MTPRHICTLEGWCYVTQTKMGVSPRVLLVDDDDQILKLTTLQLVKNGFEVVTAPSVTTALRFIATEAFDVLVTDLNMPNAADGFTVVSAMRHSHPQALILLVSGNPDVDLAMATLALEPDEILIKPLECQHLPELIREKMLSHEPAPRVDKERVGVVLNRCRPSILEDWLTRAKLSSELNQRNLSDNERTGHLSGMLDDLISRLAQDCPISLEEAALNASSAADHGRMRRLQGYTASMLVDESRILQVTLFETLQKNMRNLDFSLVLPDVMRIADEVDSQLSQAMVSFTNSKLNEAAA
jgi:DNA-binding response OmpR family regulator